MSSKMNRRDFVQASGAFAGLLYMNPQELLRSHAYRLQQDRLSWHANKGTNFEGNWQPGTVEGTIPSYVQGKILRIGPGTKSCQGTDLQHFFDGDAYLTEFSFNAGQLHSCRSKFLLTSERQQEISAKKMLFHDFGTASPQRAKGFKNSPNINVVSINNKLLALSEGAHPIQVSLSDLSAQGPWSFQGQLSKDTTFTAHPKRDPKTVDTFAFGMTMGLSPQLKAFRIDSNSGQLKVLGQVSLGGFYLVHDMAMTENFLVFLIPPMSVDLFGAAMMSKPLSQLLEYDPKGAFRVVLIRKDGSSSPIVISTGPGGTGFHHCNAYENQYGQIILNTLLNPDDSVFKAFQNWNQKNLPQITPNHLVRMVIDPQDKKVVERKTLSDGVSLDFPCVDERFLGTKMRFVHAIEAQNSASDSLAFDGLVCWDLQNQSCHRISCEPGQVFGEPLFIANPNQHQEMSGVIALMGYDRTRDESFLEFREPVSLKLIGRQWLNRYLPLGFHGSYIRA